MEQNETLLDRTLGQMWDAIDRLREGGVNCLQLPFQRGQKIIPGIERAACYDIMAQTKVGKSQFTYYLFVFKTLIDLYYGPQTYDVRYIIVAIEETPERVMQRFMSFLLYYESNGKIRVNPLELRSTLTECPKEAQEALRDEHIQDILEFFQQHVEFADEQPNPTGIRNYCIRWAEKRGKTIYNTYEVEDEFGTKIEKTTFARYEPNNPDSFNIVIIDHVGILDRERGMDERATIKKMSEYCAKDLRNKYGFTTVMIHQQNFDSYSIDAAKLNHFEPNLGAGGGSKEILRDVDVCLALYAPHNYDVENYGGYDIKRLYKRGLFVKCLCNRNGESGGIIPLFFDGSVSHFWELPSPKNAGDIQAVYNYAEQLRPQVPHTSEELAALNPFLKKREQQPEKKDGGVISFINLLFSK